jgi:hypothetical protein
MGKMAIEVMFFDPNGKVSKVIATTTKKPMSSGRVSHVADAILDFINSIQSAVK